ncbi:hypothetical protein [Hydrogenimonas sp.]
MVKKIISIVKKIRIDRELKKISNKLDKFKDLQIVLLVYLEQVIRNNYFDCIPYESDRKKDEAINILAEITMFDIKINYHEYLYSEESYALKSLSPVSSIQKYLIQYIPIKNPLNTIVREIEKDEKINSFLAKYYRIYADLYKDVNKDMESKYMLLAKKANSKIAIKNDISIKKTKKELQKLIKEEVRKFNDNRAIKIDITIEKLNRLLPIISVLLISSGYLYNYIFFKSFGISVDTYFTVNDYLSSSLENISNVFIISILSIFFLYLGVHDISKTPSAIRNTQAKLDKKIYFFLLGILFFSTLTSFFFENKEIFLKNLEVFLVAVAPLVIDKLYTEYFIARFETFFLILFSYIFVVHIIISAYRDGYLIKHTALKKYDKYKITFAPDINISSEKVILIKSNANYYFLIDKKTKNIIIITKDKIDTLIKT